MSYEDQLIREMTTDQGLPEPEDPNESNETSDDLSKVESFTAWLDAKGDTLAPPDSFEEWLKEREDLI